MKRSKELAKKAFNIIVKETKDEDPMDGDEREALVSELLVFLDYHFEGIYLRKVKELEKEFLIKK